MRDKGARATLDSQLRREQAQSHEEPSADWFTAAWSTYMNPPAPSRPSRPSAPSRPSWVDERAKEAEREAERRREEAQKRWGRSRRQAPRAQKAARREDEYDPEHAEAPDQSSAASQGGAPTNGSKSRGTQQAGGQAPVGPTENTSESRRVATQDKRAYKMFRNRVQTWLSRELDEPQDDNENQGPQVDQEGGSAEDDSESEESLDYQPDPRFELFPGFRSRPTGLDPPAQDVDGVSSGDPQFQSDDDDDGDEEDEDEADSEEAASRSERDSSASSPERQPEPERWSPADATYAQSSGIHPRTRSSSRAPLASPNSSPAFSKLRNHAQTWLGREMSQDSFHEDNFSGHGGEKLTSVAAGSDWICVICKRPNGPKLDKCTICSTRRGYKVTFRTKR